MTDQPITPTRECVKQWLSEFYGAPTTPVESTMHVATQAAQWGADTELDACCEWMGSRAVVSPSDLRAARRSKPSSLKEQALEIVKRTPVNNSGLYSYEQVEIIRRALEALPDD